MSSLQLDEAVRLLSAQVAHIADTCRIRALLIKGPAAVEQGTRIPGPSSDVDVLVDPGGLDELIATLMKMGWIYREKPRRELYSFHSISLLHPHWPCDIDIHHRFPGLDEDSARVFNEMWRQSRLISLCGVNVRVPSECDSKIIVLLHALRNPWLARHRRQLEFSRLSETSAGILELVGRGETLGALGALRSYIQDVGGDHLVEDWPAASREWIARTSATVPGSMRVMEFLDSPLEGRVRIVFWTLRSLPRRLSSLVRVPTARSVKQRRGHIRAILRDVANYRRNRSKDAQFPRMTE